MDPYLEIGHIPALLLTTMEYIQAEIRREMMRYGRRLGERFTQCQTTVPTIATRKALMISPTDGLLLKITGSIVGEVEGIVAAFALPSRLNGKIS